MAPANLSGLTSTRSELPISALIGVGQAGPGCAPATRHSGSREKSLHTAAVSWLHSPPVQIVHTVGTIFQQRKYELFICVTPKS